MEYLLKVILTAEGIAKYDGVKELKQDEKYSSLELMCSRPHSITSLGIVVEVDGVQHIIKDKYFDDFEFVTEKMLEVDKSIMMKMRNGVCDNPNCTIHGKQKV